MRIGSLHPGRAENDPQVGSRSLGGGFSGWGGQDIGDHFKGSPPSRTSGMQVSLGSQWALDTPPPPPPQREAVLRLERGRGSSERSEAIESLEAGQGLSLPSCLHSRATAQPGATLGRGEGKRARSHEAGKAPAGRGSRLSRPFGLRVHCARSNPVDGNRDLEPRVLDRRRACPFLSPLPKQTLYDGNKYTCCWGLLSGLPQGRQGGEGLLAWPALPTWAETGWCSCRGAVCGGLRCSSSRTQPCPHRMPYEGNRAFREEPTCGWGQVGAGSPLPPLPLCVLSGQGLVQGECGDRAPTHGQLCGCEELLSAWLHAAAPAQEACL